jgi:rhodanese-related sulfurtransferase
MFARLLGLATISPHDLHRLMQREPVTIIDVNARQSWLQARVPGARHLDPLGFAGSDLPPDSDSTLIFYCSNFMCRKAPNAAHRARKMGYTRVRVMSAGINGWIGAALPTESGEPASTAD